MIKKIISWVIAVTVFCSIIGYNIYQEQRKSNPDKKQIHAIFPLTGTTAAVGQHVKKTIEIYMQQNPNLPFEVKFYDNQSDPNKTISIARQISFSDKQPVFVCGIPGLCKPLIPILASMNGFLILSPSPLAEKEQADNFQRISFGHTDMYSPFVRYIQPGQNVVIIHANDESGYMATKILSANLKQKNANVLAEIVFEHKDLDNRIIILKAMSYKPDIIVVPSAPSMGFVKILKTLKEQEYPGKILADPSLRTPSLLPLFSNTELEGIYVPIVPTEKIYKEYPQVAKLLEENNLDVGYLSINVWNTMDIINHFITNQIPFTQEEFIKIGKWHGISGDLIFTANGNSTYDFWPLSVIKDGKFIPVEQVKGE